MTAGGEGAFVVNEINVEEKNFTGDLQIILHIGGFFRCHIKDEKTTCQCTAILAVLSH